MDAMTIISNNYSKVVTQYNKLMKVNEHLKKENKDIQAQKYNVLKAYEKLKLYAFRQNRQINDLRMEDVKNDVKITNFCEDSQSCHSTNSVECEQQIAISTYPNSDSEKLSKISVETNDGGCDNLSHLMQDIELYCSTKTASNPEVKLITQFKNTMVNAMHLNQSNEANLNEQRNEINGYLKQIDDEKNKSECKNNEISKMKQDISELVDALEGQYLKNKSLKSNNEEKCRIIDEYFENQELLEYKLSNAETRCNDLTMYNTELENNLKNENIGNCEKANIILNLQEQLHDYNSKLDEINGQMTLSADAITKLKDENVVLNNTIGILNDDKSILKIELKSISLQLNTSNELANTISDENKILKNSVDNLENTLKYFKYENKSLVEKSIKDKFELLLSITKMHISENEKKQYEENINEINKLVECVVTKESDIRKEIEICNSKLFKQTEDNRDLQLQLVDMQKNLDIARENLKCSQQQLQDTECELNKEKKKYSDGIKSPSIIDTETKILNSTDPVTAIETEKPIIVSKKEIYSHTEPKIAIEKEIPTIVSKTEISNSTESMTAIETKIPTIVSKTEMSISTEPTSITGIETKRPTIVSKTEISNSTKSMTAIETKIPTIVSKKDISNITEPITATETETSLIVTHLQIVKEGMNPVALSEAERGKLPTFKKKYEENILFEPDTDGNEISRLSLGYNALHVQPEKGENSKKKLASKLVDTGSQKKFNKSASPLTICKPKSHSKSNISIQENCNFSKGYVSSSDSTGKSCCTCCTANSKTSRCDCISNYINKSEKNRISTKTKFNNNMQRKEKQNKSMINDLDSFIYQKYSLAKPDDCEMQYCNTPLHDFNTPLDNVEIHTVSVTHNVDTISTKAKGDQPKDINFLQEMSKNIYENNENETMKKHEKPAIVQENSIQQIKTSQLKHQKHKIKKVKNSKKKMISSNNSLKTEPKYNFPCNACKDENCYYNKTAPKTPAEFEIFLKQFAPGRK